MAADPGVKVHLYGKAVRPGRKIGHVTVLGTTSGDRGGGPRTCATARCVPPAISGPVSEQGL